MTVDLLGIKTAAVEVAAAAVEAVEDRPAGSPVEGGRLHTHTQTHSHTTLRIHTLLPSPSFTSRCSECS